MDGYHMYKKDLDDEGIKRRGAEFTFDLKKFRNEVLRLKDPETKYPIYFPSFDHKDKDPKEKAISVDRQKNEVIIIEGLYIFDKSLNLSDFWDMKVWI